MLVFILPFLNSLSANTCDLMYADKKINHLSAEVICSNTTSLKECQDLVFEIEETKEDLSVLEAEPCCDGSGEGRPLFSPMTYAANKTLTELKDIKGVLSNQYVNSIEDFYHHTQLHRKRVKKLGLELLKMYPKTFKGLTEQQVNLALAEHDRAKISGLALADDKEQFYKKLYSGYQRKIDRATIDKLNAVDQKYMERAYEVIGLQETDSMTDEYKKELKEKRQKLKLLEQIADFVDRGMSPVSEEEFGRKMDLASEFMKDPKERKMAAALEKRYNTVVRGLEYSSPNMYEYRAIKFSMLLDTKKEELRLKFSSKQLSAMTILHKSLTGVKKAFTNSLKALASKAGMRALMVADGVGLFFGDMEMGCGQTLGHHDWVKEDGKCVPVKELSPSFIDFLFLPSDEQKLHLSNEEHTCSVLEHTYKASKKAANVTKCTNNEVVISKDNLKLKVNKASDGRILSIDILSGDNGILSSNVHGAPKQVMIGPNGELGKVCFKNISMSDNMTCLDENDSTIFKNNVLEVKKLVQSSNFEIQKANLCCLKQLNPGSVKSSLRINCDVESAS